MTDSKDKTPSKKKAEKYINVEPNDQDIVSETIDLEEAPLSISQRRQRARTMRRYKGRITIARKRASRRKASTEKLKQRASRKARNAIRKRLSGNKDYSKMSPSEKVQLDKRLARIPKTVISRMAVRQLPQVRKAEMARLARVRNKKTVRKEDINEAFENFLLEMRECPPKRHHMALTKEGSVKFDQRFKMFRPKKTAEIDENFWDDAEQLMNIVESNPCWDEYEQIGMKKKNGRKVPNCVPVKEDSPSDREESTDSLNRKYRKDTPFQKESEEIGKYDNTIERGSEISFNHREINKSEPTIRTGVVVGTNIKEIRVRDDDGVLYKVKHSDVLSTNDINELFEEKFILSENSDMNSILSAIHRHVLKGQEVHDAAWELISSTGIKTSAHKIVDEYNKAYGSDKRRTDAQKQMSTDRLIKRYGI